jgi:glyoxylase-like metal-dependent hydrolase (beta-lactamase superfamily II)
MAADRITDDDHAHAVRSARDVVTRTFGEAAKRPQVRSFFDEPTNAASHVVWDPASRRCAVIDTVLNFDAASGRTAMESADELITFIREQGLEVEWILETHVHADHLSAAPYIKERLGGALGIGENVRVVQDIFGKVFNAGTEFQHDGSQFDQLFVDGERFTIGELDAVALHTPGHTPDSMTYVVGDTAFIGDTLFMPDYGTARADFPGGNARALYRSARRVLSLPGATRLFLCHDYKAPGRSEFRWETTVAAERADNVHIHDGVSEDEFVHMRTARDAKLGLPKLILPSVQVNMRAGEFPPAEGDGQTYLKIPLNQF